LEEDRGKGKVGASGIQGELRKKSLYKGEGLSEREDWHEFSYEVAVG